jgi:hypothetical protein
VAQTNFDNAAGRARSAVSGQLSARLFSIQFLYENGEYAFDSSTTGTIVPKHWQD